MTFELVQEMHLRITNGIQSLETGMESCLRFSQLIHPAANWHTMHICVRACKKLPLVMGGGAKTDLATRHKFLTIWVPGYRKAVVHVSSQNCDLSGRVQIIHQAVTGISHNCHHVLVLWVQACKVCRPEKVHMLTVEQMLDQLQSKFQGDCCQRRD